MLAILYNFTKIKGHCWVEVLIAEQVFRLDITALQFGDTNTIFPPRTHPYGATDNGVFSSSGVGMGGPNYMTPMRTTPTR